MFNILGLTGRSVMVDVYFSRSEEYVTSRGETVWKAVYFVELNKRHVLNKDVPPLNLTFLDISLSGLRGKIWICELAYAYCYISEKPNREICISK